jgi:hypothetical protein
VGGGEGRGLKTVSDAGVQSPETFVALPRPINKKCGGGGEKPLNFCDANFSHVDPV